MPGRISGDECGGSLSWEFRDAVRVTKQRTAAAAAASTVDVQARDVICVIVSAAVITRGALRDPLKKTC